MTLDDLSHKLRDLSTDEGRYAILAIDHGRSLLNFLSDDEASDDSLLREIKTSVLQLLSVHATAVLIDVHFAKTVLHGWQLPNSVGLIVGIDEFDYDDVTFPPPNVPTPQLMEEVRQTGASAAKVVLYFDPSSEDATERCDVISKIVERCHDVGLPLLVEPLPIPGSSMTEGRPWSIPDVARLVSRAGADVLKLPFPEGTPSVKLAAEITRQAAGVPWILLSSGAPYSEFVTTLHVALTGGAAGFAAGRSIWKDLIVDITNETARREASRRLQGATDLTRSLGGPISHEP